MQHFFYSTREFENQYTYTGNDLGANWSPDETMFRLWAPTAEKVFIKLFSGGTPDVCDLLEEGEMEHGDKGVWTLRWEGNLHGKYYTYYVTVEGNTFEVCDPYARSTGVNGVRGMILDMNSTDPAGWDEDRNPNAVLSPNDAVIYELHLRDISSDPASGIRNVGKYLALTETGTKTPGGCATGLDHIKELGVTHIHILPFYDYGSVDESKPEIAQFNWGYDPVNFNVPEGSYSTDPFHGEVRVSELKKMIQTLHNNGLSVVMDVVYNHVFDAGNFCINRIVPGYFSREDKNGNLSNGSGCGNDTASERSMVRKYIVDSVCYWADEYHIDGFRFDLVGLLDVDTVNEIVRKVHSKHPNVLFYGEGWALPTTLTKENVSLAVQNNAKLTPNFAYFSDTIRDMLRGTVFDMNAKGYISGATVSKDLLYKCFTGNPDWCPSPSQTVNYASCHDNQTLFDRIRCSNPEETMAVQVKMNLLAVAFCFLSQGIPFIQAGEEQLRVKWDLTGNCVENSYNSPDSVNMIRWENLEDPVYQKVFAYYGGLILFRKKHRLLRQTTCEKVQQTVSVFPWNTDHATAFMLEDDEEKIIVLFNPVRTWQEFTLPCGQWVRYIDGNSAGITPLETCSGKVYIEDISAAVFVQKK